MQLTANWKMTGDIEDATDGRADNYVSGSGGRNDKRVGMICKRTATGKLTNWSLPAVVTEPWMTMTGRRVFSVSMYEKRKEKTETKRKEKKMKEREK